MNVDKTIVLKLLPILTAAALIGGCAMQPGGPETGESSSAEALDVTGAPIAQPNSNVTVAKMVPREERGAVVPNPVHERTPVATGQDLITGGDPGDPSQDDGDGKEPDPHPWEPHALTQTSRSNR